jgi:hypothetical protein
MGEKTTQRLIELYPKFLPTAMISLKTRLTSKMVCREQPNIGRKVCDDYNEFKLVGRYTEYIIVLLHRIVSE